MKGVQINESDYVKDCACLLNAVYINEVESASEHWSTDLRFINGNVNFSFTQTKADICGFETYDSEVTNTILIFCQKCGTHTLNVNDVCSHCE